MKFPLIDFIDIIVDDLNSASYEFFNLSITFDLIEYKNYINNNFERFWLSIN